MTVESGIPHKQVKLLEEDIVGALLQFSDDTNK